MSPISKSPVLDLVLIGDFSGRASRGAHAPQTLAERRPRRIEPEELDATMAALGVELRLASPGGGEPLAFRARSLDELAPDALLASLSTFEHLRSLRRRLADPARFAEAARELGAELGASAPNAPPPSAPSASGGLLDAALQETAARGAAEGIPRTGEEIARALVRELVIPHVIPAPHPRRDELIATVERAIGEHLRALLRDPAFRGAEIAWRSLDLLLRRVGVANAVRVHFCDATRAELEADLLREGALEACALHRALAPRGVDPQAARATLWIPLELFDAEERDAALLARFAELAGACDALVLASAHSRLYGCAALEPDSDPDGRMLGSQGAERAWEALRAAPAAARIALAAPRLLLRLPYGARGAEVEALAFEELAAESDTAGYLFGPGALGVALFLGEQLVEEGAFDPAATRALEGLPLHVRTWDGETIAQPCAEVWLRDADAARLAARGLCVLRSVRDRDAVILGALRALNGRPLALSHP